MYFEELFTDKSLKPKEKTEALSGWLLSNPKEIDALITFANNSKGPVKATCIEAIELASQKTPKIVTANCFNFVVESLSDKAPRVKWESAKVIGNTAFLFPKNLNDTLSALLKNSEHDGTVVRWSAAYAIGEIIKLNSGINKTLIPAAESICKREEKNSIIKIYQAALKKVNSKA